MAEFGEALTLQAIQPGIQYDTRTNGAGSFFRIYRDTRFSKDKTPYKSSLSAMLWVGGNEKKMENPGFYFRVDEHGVDLYAGIYGMSKDMLHAYRKKVDCADDGVILAELVEQLAHKKHEAFGERYKRIPSGFDKSHPRATLLLNKALFVKAPAPTRLELNSAKLLDWAILHAKEMAPLNQWLSELTGNYHE